MNSQLLESWLMLQCKSMQDTRMAKIWLVPSDDSKGELAAVWPAKANPNPALDDILSMVGANNPIVQGPTSLGRGKGKILRIAVPVNIPGFAKGAIAVVKIYYNLRIAF